MCYCLFKFLSELRECFQAGWEPLWLCSLTVHNGLIYSGSWDKTLKVWNLWDLECLESIKAHDDAINGLVACRREIVYSAFADGNIKARGMEKEREGGKFKKSNKISHRLKEVLEGHKDVSLNSVVVSDDEKRVYSDGDVMGWEFSESSDA
ncbi:hypothetical protein PIB30_109319, partial [Stylosanthes scabra]|nr:hypothetical protein [Stylosanthes scabra]